MSEQDCNGAVTPSVSKLETFMTDDEFQTHVELEKKKCSGSEMNGEAAEVVTKAGLPE